MSLKAGQSSTLGAILLGAGLLAACGTAAPIENEPTGNGHVQRLFDASTAIQDRWTHLPLRGTTEYRVVAISEGVAIQAIPKNSASGLIRRVDIDSKNCPVLEWRWRVGRLQETADLMVKDKEDVAASIFVLFGDPGFMSNPDPVPTLRYVWTNTKHSKDDVIDNPYLPGIVRSIVIRTGDAGSWHTEKRDVVKDYERAFGSAPKAPIDAIVLFTDNDQTKEAAVAFYGWARMHCGAEASSISMP